MSMLTFTAKWLIPGTSFPLSSSCSPPRPARALLPGTHSPLSSFSGPPRPARSVLPGTGILMTSSRSPPWPARALANQDVRLPEAWAPQRDTGWACKLKNLSVKTNFKLKINPIWEYLKLIFYPIKPSADLFFLIKSCENIPLMTEKIGNVWYTFGELFLCRRLLSLCQLLVEIWASTLVHHFWLFLKLFMSSVEYYGTISMAIMCFKNYCECNTLWQKYFNKLKLSFVVYLQP
jgi:hypothetical protein